MEFLKSLFTKPLSFEEFSKAVADQGIKLADREAADKAAAEEAAQSLVAI